MRFQPLTYEDELLVANFQETLEDVTGIDDLPFPDSDGSWMTKHPIIPKIIGGAACKREFQPGLVLAVVGEVEREFEVL